MNGVLLIDKKVGPTSFDVVAQVRRALKVKAVGHTGTLDPLASGLMVVVVGTYTRAAQYLDSDEKTYLAHIEFGTSTDTCDREGRVIASGDPSQLDEHRIREMLATFEGEQKQVPPQYSAISIKGERAYQIARRGEEVEMPSRDVVIHEIILQEWTAPLARVLIRCAKGTYIRSIARDLGEKLGVPAHLSALRRLACGSYRLEEAMLQDDLTQDGRAAAALMSGLDALRGIAMIEIGEGQALRLRQGQKVMPAQDLDAKQTDEIYLAIAGTLPVAFCLNQGGMLKPVRGF